MSGNLYKSITRSFVGVNRAAGSSLCVPDWIKAEETTPAHWCNIYLWGNSPTVG